MNIHPDNSHDEDPNDPIAELLCRASAAEQSKVKGSDEFASRLRAKIESELMAGGLQPVRLASQEVAVDKSRSRGKLVAWVAAVATVAAALVLLASLFTANRSTENQTVQVPSETVELPEVVEDVLPAADAERGMQVVNTGLGQTIQSVSLARTAIRDLLRPLRSMAPKQTVEATASQQSSRSFGVTDDQLVASFTARVLGLRN